MAQLGSMFEVSAILAWKLINDFKNDSSVIARRRAKEEMFEEKVERVREVVQDMLESGQHVWSVGQVELRVNRRGLGVIPK